MTQTPYDEWKIEKIEIVPYGVADKDKAFTIKLKSKTSAPLVELTPTADSLLSMQKLKKATLPCLQLRLLRATRKH